MATGALLLLLALAMLTGAHHGSTCRPGHETTHAPHHRDGPRGGLRSRIRRGIPRLHPWGALAVTAQAQAAASYAGLLAVFSAYAAGSATILMLVSGGTAVAGAALGRRIPGLLPRHSNRIAAAVLVMTGAYLTWYWYPAATGGTAQANGLAAWSAAAGAWIRDNTTLIAVLAAAVVLASALAAINRRPTPHQAGTPPADTVSEPVTETDSCAPTPVDATADTDRASEHGNIP